MRETNLMILATSIYLFTIHTGNLPNDTEKLAKYGLNVAKYGMTFQ